MMKHAWRSVFIIILACRMLNPLTSKAIERGTGDLGVIVERAGGGVLIVDTTARRRLFHVTGLGDLSHASVVFSRDQRYAFIFGRDGGLSKVDLLQGALVKRIVQAGNSIGGAISQNGRLIAVSNYEPGGVKVFDAETLEQLADIPAVFNELQRSKVVGLADAPGQRFVFCLFEAGEIWIADLKEPQSPVIRKFQAIGKAPYDGVLIDSGHYYLAGLFGEPGLALLDLWRETVRRILPEYNQEEERLPVYKMPHLQGWTVGGDYIFAPAVGQHEILAVDRQHWGLAEKIKVAGQPVFIIVRPDGRQAWTTFALPDNHQVQIIDIPSLKPIHTLYPGKSVLHLEFTPRGEEAWLSIRDEDKVVVYDTESLAQVATLAADKPSGIFFTARAHKIGL